MTQVRVFNPKNSPVAIGGGRTIGGAEHQMVDLDETVQALIDSGELIKKKTPVSVPSVAQVVLAEDSPADESAVSSEEAASGDETDEETPVDKPVTKPTPATISKNRRRKSPPAKE